MVAIDIPHRFTLSPNPTQGKSVLRLEEEFSSNTKISIIRLDGLLIESFLIQALHSTKELDFSHLKNGTYLIRLENANYEGQQKFIKQ